MLFLCKANAPAVVGISFVLILSFNKTGIPYIENSETSDVFVSFSLASCKTLGFNAIIEFKDKVASLSNFRILYK